MDDAAGGTWTPAYVGLGSNLDEPVQQVRAALDELAQLPHCRLVARSRLYRSEPFGVRDQPRFVNAAAGLLTLLTAPALLHHLKTIEARHGRRRSVERWGPRTLDLDLLAYDGAQLDEPDLRLPHAGIASRSFVLCPLAEIAPYLLLPGQGTVARLASACDRRGLDLIEET
ncbi:MAG: 2-amino-4-hydroxy-6-hydroxymethyldihydropteridine diphosphokinase [Gammaproteobacteria bacterium]|nr:2-amino-4-hydroxy-6-hydroxymethyldihydropteridine diphosphokinase [Gammaproteobacteria bacterium]